MDEDKFLRKDVYEAQLETVLMLSDKTNERIDDLKDTMNRHFTILGIVFGVMQIGLALALYLLSKL